MSSASLQFIQSSILGIPHEIRKLQSCHVRSVPRRLPITSTSEVAVCILRHSRIGDTLQHWAARNSPQSYHRLTHRATAERKDKGPTRRSRVNFPRSAAAGAQPENIHDVVLSLSPTVGIRSPAGGPTRRLAERRPETVQAPYRLCLSLLLCQVIMRRPSRWNR